MSKHDTETVTLSLTAEQGNLVITALAECQFKLVYELIGQLNRQANLAAQAGESYVCRVNAAELKLILDALGKLPYCQVYALMQELQRQLQSQVVREGKLSKTDRKTGKR